MEHRVAVNLFGQFEVRLDGVPVRMPTRKVELVLALLATEPDVALSRSTLAGMLWPGQPDAQARASLRQAIFRLKSALEPSDALEVTSGWIKLRSDRIERDIDAAGRGVAAAALPIGTPLEGMSGFEPEIEDRLDAARAELRARLLKWLEDAETKALAARQFADLEILARRHLVLDGYDEAALRMLMTALWRQGRRNAALDVFRETSQRIRADLSVSVDPSTTALYQDIRAQPADPGDQMRPAVTADKVAPPAPSAKPPAEAPLPHLRHIAVMHVVSGRLLAALRDRDPEDAEAASRAASDAIERVVRREGGVIAGRAGHRLSCVFGANRPDESPALSAALAAFEIARLDCAVGIDAARALIGGESKSYPADRLAQILAEAGAPGEIRITDAVADACRGAFVLDRIEPERAQGGHPAAWCLTGEVLSRGGFDIRKARGLTPFVARDAEVQTILAVAASSGPRAVAITGDAGIGKSRLVHECLGRLGPRHLLRAQFLPNEIGGGVARFSPVLTSLLPPGGADDPAHVLDAAIPDETLRRRIAPVEALFAAHSAPAEDAELPRGVRLQALADALLLAIQLLAGRDSILLVEDAHWSDDDGALFLERILRSLDPDGPMVIVTLRPGRALNLSGVAGLRSVTLAPLSDAESVRLLTLLGRDASGGIAARSGGVPLFLEEIARSGTMTDDGSQPVPETLAGLLTRRIDALPPHLRRTIEAAAVLGAEPADDLLQPLSGLRSDAYEAAIAELADGDLLFRIRSVPQRIYGFKHALVQEAAYQAILKNRCKDLHAKVVELREGDWRAGDKSLSPMLAHHALASDQPAKAVELALAATKQALTQSNYPLADAMLALALKAVMALEPTEDNRRLEAQILAWQRPLAWPMSKTRQVDKSLFRSESIARELNDQTLIAEICIQRAYLHTDDGQFERSHLYCDHGRDAAKAAGSAYLLAESALARCQAFTFQGRMRRALSTIASYRHAWDAKKAHRGNFTVTRFVMLKHLLSRAHAGLGESDAAIACVQDMIEAAHATGRPIDRYKTALTIGDLLSCAGRNDQAQSVFHTALTIARDAELTYYAVWSEALHAEHLIRSGAERDGAALLQRLLGEVEHPLNLVPRLSAEATLLCQRLEHEGGRDLSGILGLLKRVRDVDLPAVELRILETLARCDPNGPQAWATAAQAILAEEHYARCDLSDAQVHALMEAMA